MGRKIQCSIDISDSDRGDFVDSCKEFFLNRDYTIQIEPGADTGIFEAGSTAWTVLGTTRWSKTERTVILSVDNDAENCRVRLIYDVSWFSMHVRPQSLIRNEIEDLLEFCDCQCSLIEIEYLTRL